MGHGGRRSDTSRKKKSIAIKAADLPRLKIIREEAKCKDNNELFRWMLLLAEKYLGINGSGEASSTQGDLDACRVAEISGDFKPETCDVSGDLKPDPNDGGGDGSGEEISGDIVSDAARVIREAIKRDEKGMDASGEDFNIVIAEDDTALCAPSESEKEDVETPSSQEEVTPNRRAGRPRRSKGIRVRQSKVGGFKCSKCPFRYPTEEAAQIHEASHDAKIQVCNKCDKEFMSLDALKAHVRFVHDKRYDCDACDKKFGTRYLLMQHQRSHTGEKPFPCDTCSKAFATSSSLKAHMESHNADRSYLCHECGAAYRRRDCLKQHILRCHQTADAFQCELCGKSFKYRESLKNHLEHHRNVEEGRCPYQCHLCGKGFTVAATLQRHMSTHRSVFKCDTCNREFSHRHHLKRHLIVHTGERPFVCQHCDRTFGLRTTLLTHLRLHTGEKPYKCSLCPIAFRRNYSLRNHMKKAHAIEVPKRGPGSLPLKPSNHQDNVPQEVLMELQLPQVEDATGEKEMLAEGVPIQLTVHQIEYDDGSNVVAGEIPQNVSYDTATGAAETVEAGELVDNADSQQAVMTLANMSHQLMNVQQMEELQQQVQQQLQQAAAAAGTEDVQHVQEVHIQHLADGTQTVEYVAFPVNFTSIPTTSEADTQDAQLMQ